MAGCGMGDEGVYKRERQLTRGRQGMRFAINYSAEAEKLWRAGRIKVDLFKCPDWPRLVREVGAIHRLYVHTSLCAGRGIDSGYDLERLGRWLETSETLAVNTHFFVFKSDFPPASVIEPEAVIKRALRDVAFLGERFGSENVLIENVPYWERGYEGELVAAVVEPAVISQVVARSGCGFLLDIAHAIRACEGTGRADVKAYLNALPVHALRELHVTGLLPEPDEDGVRHDHFALTEEDWAMTEWALQQIRAGGWRKPEIMAFEYGGVGEKFAWRSEAAVIAEQAPRLYEMAQSV